ncbi:MAG: hypothetical protein QOD03_1780, partial [Verrucomicrobiota bacterium]
ETVRGFDTLKIIRIAFAKHTQEQFGETPNWTRETRVLPITREHRISNFALN